MALLRIRVDEDPVLRKKAKPIKSVDNTIKKLIEDMAETMYEAPGVGLAAPQVGVSKRLILVDTDDGQGLHVLINPKITNLEGPCEAGLEGCLSVPNIFGEVERQLKVTIKGLNKKGKGVTISASGFRARALQHEIDHLDGIIFTDKAQNLRKIEEPYDEEDNVDLSSVIEDIKENKLKELIKIYHES